MNIQNLLNVNFTGKVDENKGAERKPYLAPQKPDTFERTTETKVAQKKDNVLDKIAKMYNKMTPLKLDKESSDLTLFAHKLFEKPSIDSHG